MSRLGDAVVAVLATAGLVATGVAVNFALEGVSTRVEPSRAERWAARTARHLLIPERARQRESPVEPTPEGLRSGMRHFADHCAICHANDGSGDTAFGRRMSPRPPDLRALDTQRLSDGELFWIIENGVRMTGMPGFGEDGPGDDRETWELVGFLRRLPSLSADDLEEMERFNPTLSRAGLEEEREIESFLDGEPADGAPAGSGGEDRQ